MQALVKYEHNEQRTSFRQEVSRQKEALQQQRQWQLQQQESERERRLAELRAQVRMHMTSCLRGCWAGISYDLLM